MGIPYAPFEEFHLIREEDATGTSGTGVVARGIVMPSGIVHMEWLSHVHTETRFNSLRDVELLHGHEGKTNVVMGYPPVKKARKKKAKKKAD